jgi:hypothetical protein
MTVRPLTALCIALASAVSVTACAEQSRAAEPQSQLGSTPDQVVAEVAGRKITLKDIDEKWEQFDSAERARVSQLLYQNRRTMLDQLVGDILIEQAAKAANMSAEAYLAQESAKRTQPVSDAEVKAFYDQNKDRASGRSLDELRKPISDFLQGQRRLQARAQLIDELRTSSSSVRVMLEPPRYTVALAAHDPVLGESTAPVTLVEFSDYQ